MTKEEYRKLLESDYWKGYSYSLIKERNFTCEDCGLRFYNERNKLQVHHLVYRDVNPWSYKPEEVIVLCENCHQKRHGIMPEPDPTMDSMQGYEISYSDYSNNEEKRSDFSKHFKTTAFSGTNKSKSRNPWPEKSNRGFKLKYVLYVLLALFVFYIGNTKLSYKKNDTDNIEVKRSNAPKTNKSISNKNNTKNIQHPVARDEYTPTEQSVSDESQVEESSDQNMESVPEQPKSITEMSTTSLSTSRTPSDEDLSTINLLEKKNHEQVVKQARRAGVSTEGSTTDILERINHAQVVKQARRAGVSTEGSTTDILERINHAQVVKQARRAGVSTEGSTTDILERINHAQVVKQARRAGVSTEGSTTDILERINRKMIESR